jgi:hypothetical protein
MSFFASAKKANKPQVLSSPLIFILSRFLWKESKFIKMCVYTYVRGFQLSEAVLEKVEEIGRKLDGLKDFLEDVFLTTEEYMLLKEVDEIVADKRFNELKPFDEF